MLAFLTQIELLMLIFMRFSFIEYEMSIKQENPSKHPIIILKDVSYSHLQAILEFMYAGEVNVSQEQLPAFLKTADRLKVKGLAGTPSTIKRE